MRSTLRSVRVVQIGEYSRELCGGTHLNSAGQVGLFKVVAEEPVSAGTRRITALTGHAALEAIRQEQQILAGVAAALKVAPGQAVDRVQALLDEIKTLKKQAAQSKVATAPKLVPDDLLAAAATVGSVRVVAAAAGGMAVDELRQLVDVLRRKQSEGLAIL